MSEKIYIDGKEISVKSIDEQDYISLTDMVRDRRNPSQAINNWLRNRDTLELLSFWESMNNPNFNLLEFEKIRNEAGSNAFTISVKNWIQETGAIGLEAKAGRYGGTFGHRDLAFAFASWVSPLFQLMLIREFQHLKSHEYQRQKLEWDAGRFLSKVNYSLQADAIENNILPRISEKDGKYIYANEADLINLVIFGMTAKEWREANPDARGNIRDHASLIQLVVLSNLETHNADYIRAGASKEARYRRLCEIAAKQVEIFSSDIRLSDDRKFLK